MPNPVISLCHTTARPTWAVAREAWLSRADNKQQIEHILAVDKPSPFEINYLEVGNSKMAFNHGERCCVAGWNVAAAKAKGKLLIAMADDFVPPEHWDTLLLARIPDLDGEFVVETRSGGPEADAARLIVLSILTHRRYQRFGYIFYPGYKSLWCDNEFTDRARMDGVVIDARDLVFDHRHWTNGKAQMDNVYKIHNAPDRYYSGQALYNKRKDSGFPV